MALAGHGFSRAATSQQKSRALAPEGLSASGERQRFMEITPNNWGANSLDLVEVVMAFEEAFDTEIPDEEMEKIRGFRTVEEFLDYLRKRKKGGDSN
jgi:acyl carrier protein